MIKEIIATCDYSFFFETALIMFLSIFVIVSLRALAGNTSESRRHARIALTEQPEKSPYE